MVNKLYKAGAVLVVVDGGTLLEEPFKELRGCTADALCVFLPKGKKRRLAVLEVAQSLPPVFCKILKDQEDSQYVRLWWWK